MKKLRFKNRNDILYYGVGDKFKSSGLKYNTINKNIIISRVRSGELDVELGVKTPSTSIFLSDVLEEVMQSKLQSIKQNTHRLYKGVIESHILKFFKNAIITEIKPINIKAFQDSLVAQGYAKPIINHSRGLLSEAFELCIISGTMTINPIKMISAPKQKKKTKEKQKPFTLDEIDTILDTAKGEIKNFLGISFFTGMRSGELLALKWEDLDFKSDTISITKTISCGSIGTTKTVASTRDIEMLSQARKFFQAQRLKTGLKDSFVFLNTKGNHYINNFNMTHKLKRVLKDCKIEYRSLHNTRHTFASIMLNNKIEPIWVSNMLGHENLKITLDTYAHFIPRKEKMSIEFLEKRYKNGTVAD